VASVPRLMPGQGTIVATGAIGYPPGLAQADPARLQELGVAKVMTMTSTYDHRVIQGAESGAFLKRVDELLQGADQLYEQALAELGVEAGTVDRVGTEGSAQATITADEPAPAAAAPAAEAVPDESLLQAVQAATSVVKAHRMHGHLAARLDPLGSPPRGDPALDPASVNLTPELMECIPASVLRVAVPGETFAEALPHLADTYTGTIAYEIEHISGHNRRMWLRETVESGRHRSPLDSEHKRRLLERLSEVEALESYLHKAFLARSSSRSRASTCSCRCSTRRLSCRPSQGPARWCSAWPIAAALTCWPTPSGAPTSRSWWSSRESRRSRPTPRRPRAAPAT